MTNSREDQRHRLTRRRFVGTAAATAGLAVAAPTLASAAPGSTRRLSSRAQSTDNSIIIGTLGEAFSINPFLTNESEGDFRCKQLFDRLVHLNQTTYAPEAGLASEWTIDGNTITFKLQPNAKFSDGSDVTAEDVAFTYKGHIDPKTGSSRQSKFLVIEGAAAYADGSAADVSGLKVIDPKTLQVTLAQPDAPFILNSRYIFPVPAALLAGKNLADDPFFQDPIGAGPFIFEKWDNGADFVATKNPTYWKAGAPGLDKFTHRVIADSQSIVLALQSGDIDASNYPVPTAAEELKADPNLVVLVPPFASPNGWMFNTEHEWLSKKEVRKAIAMALDTKQFAADSLLGLGEAGNGPIAPDNWAYDKELTPIPYDVEAAKALIAESGMPDGTTIRFTVNQGNVLREDWLTFSQQALKEIGIDVQAEPQEYATLVTAVTEAGDYDACGVDFCGVTVDPSELYDQFHTGSAGNYTKYSNPDLDAALEQARQTIDIEAAKPIYKQIQDIMMDELPMFFAWYRPFLQVVGSRYTGFVKSAGDTGIVETLEDWSVIQ